MANTMLRVEFTGGPELERALKDLPRFSLVTAQIRAAQMTALEPVAETARALAPKDFGDMAESIRPRTVPRRRGGRRGDLTVGVGPDRAHFYGMFHEFGWNLKINGGTRPMAARPFLRPAWDQHRRGVLDSMKAALWERIEKTAKRLARKAAKST